MNTFAFTPEQQAYIQNMIIQGADELAKPVNYSVERNIYYTSSQDPYHRERGVLDIYHPTGKNAAKVLVFFHGGALSVGDKRMVESTLESLKRQGIIVVTPNYRLSPKATYPAYIEDAAEAVAWTIKNIQKYGGDPKQIYVGGHSAGGYLTLMLALDKQYLQHYGVDADIDIQGYFPVSGQTATHYTVKDEMNLPHDIPAINDYAPLQHARKLMAPMTLITADRHLEQTARWQENDYLRVTLEALGTAKIPMYELQGFTHENVNKPAMDLIANLINPQPSPDLTQLP